jgi:hypothetical protein
MSKKLLISEEEKKEIKKLYNINEGWIDDAISFLKDKGEDAYEFIKDKLGLGDESDEEIKDKEFSKTEKEKIDKNIDDIKSKEKDKKGDKEQDGGGKNYIIGDSQTPYIDMNSNKASRIKKEGGEDSLWLGSMGLKWLKNAVLKYPETKNVNSITINIGTNGGFNYNEDISGLVSVVRKKFPGAKLFAVQGSWGWGGNKDITEKDVKKYYNKFRELGVNVISPAIGNVKNPHGNLDIYKEIGKALDKAI